MKITFTVSYRTNWGESLHLYGDIAELGANDPVKALPMEMADANTWRVTVDVPARIKSFTYRYVVKADHQAWRFEWGSPHIFRQVARVQKYTRCDAWCDQPADKPFYSSCFTESMLARADRKPLPALAAGEMVIKVYAPMVEPDEEVCLAGAPIALGAWDTAKALPMSDAEYPLWQVAFPAAALPIPFEYKFFIRNKVTGRISAWENCSNRVLNIPAPAADAVTTVDGLRLANPRYDWKAAGTAIPVFSIRTEHDFGVGDFLDLMPMVDWCALTGQKVLQLLPVNDTTMTGTWTDSYPYNANSTFALHPLYLNLADVGRLRKPARQKHYEVLGRELNALKEVDYERVSKGKMDFMREIYPEKKSTVFRSKAYKDFIDRNIEWLRPYAAFCCLRDQFGTPDMSKWGEMAVYDRDRVNRYCAQHDDDISFVYFVQYYLDRQLRRARDYAHSKGVPVLIDGAQAAPHLRIDVRDLDADFYAFSSHKMYGPCGIGVLYGKKKWLQEMPPYQGGGEMIDHVSFSGTTFAELPFKFEAGTPDFIDIAALSQALDFIDRVGLKEMEEHEISLLRRAEAGLRDIGHITIYGTSDHKGPVLSFLVDGQHPYDVGVLLDQMGVAVRTGHHCAQPLMERLGIPGTVRASFAVYNTAAEVDAFLAAIRRITAILHS